MCRFKRFPCLCTLNRASVSIHPMCRFKSNTRWVLQSPSLFQYIQCVGSSPPSPDPYRRSWVSIHPMCRFKETDLTAWIELFQFQYIQCVGSSHPHPHRKSPPLQFQYIQCVGSRSLNASRRVCPASFNTSNVSVQGY